MRGRQLCVAALLVACALQVVLGHGDHKEARQVTSYSFSPPFFPDAGLAAVPGWEVRGGTMVNTNYIRLTPDIGGKTGYLLARRPTYFRSLELTIQFRIHSEGRKPGADGLAFWITESALKQGPVIGGPDKWRGIAIIMDTFDNNGDGMQPSVAVHYNDGSKSYSVDDDGQATMLGQCGVSYRNQEVSNLHVYYEDGKLHIFHDAQNSGAWVECCGPFEIELPVRYYLGFSAATGGLSDNHDLYSFTVGTMDPPDLEYALPPSEVRRKDRDENRAQKMMDVKEEKAAQLTAENPGLVQLPPAFPELPKVQNYGVPEQVSENTDLPELLEYIQRQRDAIEQLELQLQHAGEQFETMEREAEEAQSALREARSTGGKDCDAGSGGSGLPFEGGADAGAIAQLERKIDELLGKSSGKRLEDVSALLQSVQTDLSRTVISAKTAVEKEIQTLYGVMNNDNRADAIQHEETTKTMARQIGEVSTLVGRVQTKLETMQKNHQSLTMKINALNSRGEPSNTFPIILACVQIVLLVVVLGVTLLGGNRRRSDKLY